MIHLTSLLNYICRALLPRSTLSFFQKHTPAPPPPHLLPFVVSPARSFIQVLLYNMPREPKAKRCARTAKARSTRQSGGAAHGSEVRVASLQDSYARR